MKKRGLAFLMAGVCAVAFGIGAVAEDFVDEIQAQLRHDFVIEVDGDVKEFKNEQGSVVYPILYNGTTYLPIRAIGELMGKNVFWYGDDKHIEIRGKVLTDADVVADEKVKNANILSENNDFIGVDEAKRVAFEAFGLTEADVKFARAELDRDGGLYHYEVEFSVGSKEYELEIGAVNGAILSREIDDEDDHDFKKIEQIPQSEIVPENVISKEKAKEIAIAKAGIGADGVVFKDFELDRDGGRLHYEIEFVKDGMEYELDINAEDGAVLKFEKERR